MKTSTTLSAIAAGALALSIFVGCDEAQHGGAASGISTHNYALGAYHSTPEQLRIARHRADRHYAKLSPGLKNRMRDRGVRYLAVRTLDPSKEQLAEIKRRAAAAGASGGSSFGYGASAVSGPVHETGSAPKPWHCVMVWDTYSRDLVGSECYAVTTLPPAGESVRFDTHVAEYIGDGE